MNGNTEKPFTHREICGLVEETAQTLTSGMKHIANAITPQSVADGLDTPGGHVSCLTESIVCLTSAMIEVANAIDNVAEAINKHGATE